MLLRRTEEAAKYLEATKLQTSNGYSEEFTVMDDLMGLAIGGRIIFFSQSTNIFFSQQIFFSQLIFLVRCSRHQHPERPEDRGHPERGVAGGEHLQGGGGEQGGRHQGQAHARVLGGRSPGGGK